MEEILRQTQDDKGNLDSCLRRNDIPNKRLVDTEEAARILGITLKAIHKRFERGKLEGEFVKSDKGGGKGGMVLMVYVEDESHGARGMGHGAKDGDEILPPRQAQGQDDNKKRYRVHRGEPGCRIVTKFKNGIPIVNQKAEGSEQKAVSTTSNLPAIINDRKIVPERSSHIGNLKFAFIQKINEELVKPDPNLPLFKNGNGKPSRTKKIQGLLDLYNSGFLLPKIHEEIGEVKRSTLYNWLHIYNDGGIEGLAPQYGHNALSKVTPAEKQFLRQFLLNQNHPKIADSIRQCKYILGDHSPSSPATLRRYVDVFKKEFHDVWTLDREGQKAWNDKDAPYQDRAWWTLQVGEILVADGHKLNFKVINPHTGKESRAVLVMFWDWYSSYPVGWEIMLTENVQCVATALRNAILALGKIPKCVYLDNGKAFKAKCFTRKIVLEETEIPGMFARLGIDVVFATKYNAQAKPIERIFRVMEWLERQISSFVGESINDKPANLKPNEDRAKKLRGEWTPKLEQVNDLIRQWRDFYAIQPLRGRKNQTAKELFGPGRGPGVDPKALCFLMMKAEIKGIRRNRVTFDGFDWEGECLYGRKGRAIVRYSLSERSQVYVFDLEDRFLGIIEPVDFTAPRDHAAAQRITSERRRLLRQTKAISNLAKAASPEVIELISRKNPDLIEYIQREEEKKEVPRISPFIEEPEGTCKQGQEAEGREQKAESRMQNAEGRPWFFSDYDKHDWLMVHKEFITTEDQAWIEDFISRSSLYKHTAQGGNS